jgi:predicted nucleotidyltransferase
MKYGFYSDMAVQEKMEKREEERKRVLQRITDALDLLAREIKFSEAHIFGSLIHPYRFRENSDVDIGFLGLADEDFFRTIGFLSRAIGRDVDVIQLESHPLKDKIQTVEIIEWTKSN